MSTSTMPLPLDAYRNKLLPLRQQAVIRNQWLKERLDQFLPRLLQREGFDMWIIAAREYNEDPVIMTFLPEPAMAARRRTILVFTLQADGTVERLTLDRYGHGEYHAKGWDPDQEDHFACLGRIVHERKPERIGLNFASEFPFGDGLSHSEYELIINAIGDTYATRVQSAERLAVGWLEHRIAPERTVYPGLAEMAHALIAEAFSSRTIQPGITTTEDVVWWFRQKMHDLGLRAWFQPSVEIQAPGFTFDGPAGGGSKERRSLIQPGDLLHCDVGFYYLGLTTDHQQNAYVLKPGERDAPEGLRILLAEGNRLQDIHMAEMQVGRTGNEILKVVLERSKAEGIDPQVYSHPIGYHGHAAGPIVGLWDQQGGVPGKGDYELFDNTCYSIELNAKKAIPEWNNQIVRMALEEDAILTDGTIRWLDGRQSRLHLIT